MLVSKIEINVSYDSAKGHGAIEVLQDDLQQRRVTYENAPTEKETTVADSVRYCLALIDLPADATEGFYVWVPGSKQEDTAE